MIASLPMYDWPETHKHHDSFWQRLQPALHKIHAATPLQLNRTDEQNQWQRNDIVLSQTCAYPLVTQLPKNTVVVGTPIYKCDYFDNGYYASVVLVHRSDKRQTLSDFSAATLAFNSVDSQSGFNALKTLLVENQLIDKQNPTFFASSICTKSHRNSMQSVATHKADICAIDPVSWALAQRYDTETKKLRVLTNTAYSPALPLICSAQMVPSDRDKEQWCASLRQAFDEAIDSEANQHLLLNGIAYIPKEDYLALPISHLDMIAEARQC